jgi:hypothetical protein
VQGRHVSEAEAVLIGHWLQAFVEPHAVVCVNCTLLAAANRDYRVTAVTDGVATIDDALQDACLRIWERKFARLRTGAQIVAELRAAMPAPGNVSA